MDAAHDPGNEQTRATAGGDFAPVSLESSLLDENASLLQELDAARTALRAHEDRLALTLECAEAGLWDWDPIHDVLIWSPQMEGLYGVPAEAVRAYEDWRLCVHPDDIVRAEMERAAALRDRLPYDLEFRVLLPDGGVRWILSRGRGFYDEAGTLVRVMGITQDITRRKAAEAERAAEHARQRAQWESTPIASFLWQAAGDDFTLVEFNPAADRLSKGKAPEFLGRTATQVYPDRPDILDCFRTCLAQQGIVRLESEYQARGTGATRAMEFTFAYVAPDTVLLQAVDATEFRRAEENLRFTQTVVDKMTDATYWIGADGSIAYVNEAGCAALNYSRDELLAMNIAEIVAGATPVGWAAHWEELARTGTLRFESELVRKDGTLLPVEVQATHVVAAGREYACGLVRDIRNRKAMERALHASEAKFAGLFALSPVALTITRVADSVFLDANEEFVQLSGFTHAELAGHTALDLNLYADPAQRNAIAGATLRNGRVSGHPATIRTKDGATSECLVSAAIEEIDGVPCFLAGIVDVGPLRAVEAALRAGEAKFASLFELSPVSLSLTRIDDGRFVDVNHVFEQTTGYGRAELLGHTALELDLYADPVEREQLLADVERQGSVRSRSLKFRTRSGVVSECLISVVVVSIGGVDCYLSGIVDVEPLRQAEAALRAHQADMVALLENTDSIIWSVDIGYRLTACNSVYRC
ncbi:MAG: PAS domain S-box protein, partial [Caldilineaceae bacterium]|nr:PAS domain S-box protein [Caldilineaceae bacterium]